MVIGIDNINLSDCHKFYCILAIWKRVDVILTFRACTYFSTTSSYVSLRLSMNYTFIRTVKYLHACQIIMMRKVQSTHTYCRPL